MKKFKETPNTPEFIFHSEELLLEEIVKRKVTCVTFLYLSRSKVKKCFGILGFFGRKKIVQEVREASIVDEEGIKICFQPESPTISIHFSKKCEWDKIIDFDHLTVLKGHESIIFKPYYLVFNVANLKDIK